MGAFVLKPTHLNDFAACLTSLHESRSTPHSMNLFVL